MNTLEWRAAVPGDFSRQAIPMLCVDAATESDYASSGDDCAPLKTFIWYRSRRAEKAARRIARELATSGVAIVYPCDRDLAIQSGARHRVVFLGGQACPR